MRERLKLDVLHAQKKGITPARAGKTLMMSISVLRLQDHPRSCGKDLASNRRIVQIRGITPARAGKTSNGSLYLRHFAFAGI